MKLNVPVRHRENLLWAKKSRISRIYHSDQIKQNGKISWLCSDFNGIIKKKSPVPTKWKNMRLKSLTSTEIKHLRNPRRTCTKRFKRIHDSIIFGEHFFFALKKNIFNEFWRKFQETEGSWFHSGRQQKFGLRAADFRRVCYQCMQWIRFFASQ